MGQFGLTPIKLMNRRFEAMIKERSEWIDHWRELSQYILPRLGRWLVSDRNEGGKKNGKIVNDTGTVAHRTLKDNIFGGTSNPSRRWFRLVPPIVGLKDNAAVKQWLHIVEVLIYEIFERSNFYASIASVDEEETLFGTAAMVIEPNFDDVIRCKVFTAGQYAISLDSDGKASALVREFEMTVDQMMEAFGWEGPERCSDSVVKAYKRGDLEHTRTIRHIIEKVDDRYTLRNQLPDHRWRSAYWDPADNQDGERFLRTSGYHVKPLVTPRWDVTAEDTYGRSPAMDALPKIKGAQQLDEDISLQVELVGMPPSVAHPSMKNEAISLLPAAVTFGSHMAPGMPSVAPAYQINPRISEMEDRLARIEESIRRTMYSDMFLIMSQSLRPQATATEVNSIDSEKIQTLSQVLERQRSELLDECIFAAFEYGFRARIFPEPPEELDGLNLKIEHISSLAQAQRALQTQAMDRVVQAVGALAEVTNDPSAGLKIDPHQAADEYADLMGTPPNMMRSDDDVERLVANQRKRQAQQERLAAGQQTAEIAKTASETHLEDGRSALDSVVEGMSQ